MKIVLFWDGEIEWKDSDRVRVKDEEGLLTVQKGPEQLEKQIDKIVEDPFQIKEENSESIGIGLKIFKIYKG